MSLFRVMPCSHCGDQGAMLRNGKPYTMGRAPFGKFPLKSYCARCKRITLVTAADWNQAKLIESPE